MSFVPDVGDIVIVDFNPQAGHEQAGKRPALVLSPKNFNKITGFFINKGSFDKIQSQLSCTSGFYCICFI